MKLFKSRRAVTPIVATVLLIVFALGLGLAVMGLGGDYLKLDDSGNKDVTAPAVDVLQVINSCKDKGAITEEQYEVLKNKVS
jgi:flagellin-like protein